MACSDYFAPYIAWLTQPSQPGTVHASSPIVYVTGVANRPSQSCYYLVGTLTYNREKAQLVSYADADQYFNDRSPGNNPFNPTAVDRVGLALTLPNGPLVMTLKSWGNGLMTYTLECKDNLLFGYCSDIALIMSLKNGTTPI